ncbi:MAG: isoprenyl transferase [Candidatus Eisenbacteria bacterium]|nr:isoprenyl transferase [Candidatus Eisenbacteria bacterium]
MAREGRRGAGVPAEALPRHVAIIMDGNGRWARRRGLPRVAGHAAARTAVREIVIECSNLGLDELTLYTFSMENWRRPRTEVAALMRLLDQTLKDQVDEMDENNVHLRAVGRIELLPKYARSRVERSIEKLSENTGLTLNLALSYGGRREILDAARGIAAATAAGELDPDELDEETFRGFLYIPDMLDPDLLIRTSGEFRLSNFLLWQVAYSEIYVTDVLWPDFRPHHLHEALRSYASRERRFGGVAERKSGRR